MTKGISPVIYGDGTETRDFSFVEHVVTANKVAMTSSKGYQVYNVGTGTENSFNKIVKIINMYLGIKQQSTPKTQLKTT